MKTLIHNAQVIADGFREIPCGAVLVEEGKIIALMPEAEWTTQAENADEVIDEMCIRDTSRSVKGL